MASTCTLCARFGGAGTAPVHGPTLSERGDPLAPPSVEVWRPTAAREVRSRPHHLALSASAAKAGEDSAIGGVHGRLQKNPKLDYDTQHVQYWISDVIAVRVPGMQDVSPQRMAAAGLRAFERIAGAWGLSVDEQLTLLGQPPRSTFFAWRKHPEKAALPRDTLERLSNLLGIYKALQILLPEPAASDAWVRKPNAASLFGGRSALDRMLAGNVSDIHLVRSYLDGMRGGGWS